MKKIVRNRMLAVACVCSVILAGCMTAEEYEKWLADMAARQEQITARQEQEKIEKANQKLEKAKGAFEQAYNAEQNSLKKAVAHELKWHGKVREFEGKDKDKDLVSDESIGQFLDANKEKLRAWYCEKRIKFKKGEHPDEYQIRRAVMSDEHMTELATDYMKTVVAAQEQREAAEKKRREELKAKGQPLYKDVIYSGFTLQDVKKSLNDGGDELHRLGWFKVNDGLPVLMRENSLHPDSTLEPTVLFGVGALDFKKNSQVSWEEAKEFIDSLNESPVLNTVMKSFWGAKQPASYDRDSQIVSYTKAIGTVQRFKLGGASELKMDDVMTAITQSRGTFLSATTNSVEKRELCSVSNEQTVEFKTEKYQGFIKSQSRRSYRPDEKEYAVALYRFSQIPLNRECAKAEYGDSIDYGFRITVDKAQKVSGGIEAEAQVFVDNLKKYYAKIYETFARLYKDEKYEDENRLVRLFCFTNDGLAEATAETAKSVKAWAQKAENEKKAAAAAKKASAMAL